MLALPKPRSFTTVRQHRTWARPVKASSRTYMMLGGRTWRVDTKYGHWYDCASINGVVYFFNPEPLHLERGAYRIEIRNGWPHFERVGD